MGVVRFAEVCDVCRVRGPEYEAWLADCEDCDRGVCPQCIARVVKPFCCGAPDCMRKRAVVTCIECDHRREILEAVYCVCGNPGCERVLEDGRCGRCDA